jgi:hypothetical protein
MSPRPLWPVALTAALIAILTPAFARAHETARLPRARDRLPRSSGEARVAGRRAAPAPGARALTASYGAPERVPLPAANPYAVTAMAPLALAPRRDVRTQPVRVTQALSYAALGIGGTGLVIGSLSGFMAVGRNRAAETCVGPDCPAPGKHSGDPLTIVSAVGLAVGAAGLGTAGVLWLVDRKLASQVRQSAFRVRPRMMKVGPKATVLGVKTEW